MPAEGDLIAERYELVRGWTRDGFDETWLARDTAVDRIVAVKFGRTNLGVEASRFLKREIDVCSLISDLRVQRLLDHGEFPSGDPFAVFDYEAGDRLDEVLQSEGPLEPRRAVDLMIEIAAAVEVIHAVGFTHGDLKPSAMQVVEGPGVGVRLLDLRIAVPIGDQLESPVGTPAYMGPERLGVQIVDQRSDIYSLGCVFHEMLAGSSLFNGSLPLLAAQQRQPAAIDSKLEQIVGVTPALRSVVLKCLAVEPSDRFFDTGELINALRVVFDPVDETHPDDDSTEPPTTRPALGRGGRVRPATTGVTHVPTGWARLDHIAPLQAVGLGLVAGMCGLGLLAAPGWTRLAVGAGALSGAVLLARSARWVEHLCEDSRDRQHVTLKSDVPDVFQEGNSLKLDHPEHVDIFKGRRDLVAILDRDLSAKQRAPLLLTGQRRMGKSSLLSMLPRFLSTVETVVVIDFQQVAGEPDRGHPHRILAARLHAEVPDLPTPPGDDAWGPTLTWFREVDALLAERDHRVLLAIDEIERLQDGITAGWAPPDFLDFLRAAGDQLDHIRMLLVSAHPMQRLGPVWSDRLISAIQRPIGPLEPEHARELLEKPIPEFPPIWPAGAVERICRLTGNHPFLLQAVGNKVVQALNTRGVLEADDADVQRALNRTVEYAAHFPDLWKDRTEGERALLRRLAGSDEADSLRSRPLEVGEQTMAVWLRREGFIVDVDAEVRIATPLFATWIRIYGAPNV